MELPINEYRKILKEKSLKFQKKLDETFELVSSSTYQTQINEMFDKLRKNVMDLIRMKNIEVYCGDLIKSIINPNCERYALYSSILNYVQNDSIKLIDSVILVFLNFYDDCIKIVNSYKYLIALRKTELQIKEIHDALKNQKMFFCDDDVYINNTYISSKLETNDKLSLKDDALRKIIKASRGKVRNIPQHLIHIMCVMFHIILITLTISFSVQHNVTYIVSGIFEGINIIMQATVIIYVYYIDHEIFRSKKFKIIRRKSKYELIPDKYCKIYGNNDVVKIYSEKYTYDLLEKLEELEEKSK